MGVFSCFAEPGTNSKRQQVYEAGNGHLQQEVNRLTAELVGAEGKLADLQKEVHRLQVDNDALASSAARPTKRDASTGTPTMSVGVQAKPPVTVESRIPKPVGEETALSRVGSVVDADFADASNKSPGKSKIPAYYPPDRSAHATTNSNKALNAAGQPAEATADPAGQPADMQRAPSGIPADPASTLAPSTSNVAAHSSTPEQRCEVLQQQLKVTEAFRQSLEAQLRDANFANSSLQTHVLSLQTKCEKTVEEQVAELEKLSKLRREGQEAHDHAVKELHAVKQQLAEAATAKRAAQQHADATAKTAAEQEVKLQETASEMADVKQQLASVKGQSAALLQQLQEAQQCASDLEGQLKEVKLEIEQQTDKHLKAMQQIHEELKAQKAISDSNMAELMQLNSNYNTLKQEYHKLQSEHASHSGMLQLYKQEITELSYYAAAGRVALNNNNATSARTPTQGSMEVSARNSSDAEKPTDSTPNTEGAHENTGDIQAANKETSGRADPEVSDETEQVLDAKKAVGGETVEQTDMHEAVDAVAASRFVSCVEEHVDEKHEAEASLQERQWVVSVDSSKP